MFLVALDSILTSLLRISARIGPRLASVQLVCPLSCVGLYPTTPLLLVAEVVEVVVALVETVVAAP